MSTLPPLPPIPRNYLLVFRDLGRGDVYMTVFASSDDEATQLALLIEDSTGLAFAWDCLKLLPKNK